jgi:large subunit ribosomal protein L25
MSMDKNTLEAKARDLSGKGSARRLRAQGLIPAVVYGKHLDRPLQISVDPVAVRKAVATPHKLNTLLSLKLDGQGDRLVLLKDYQSDPVSRALLHADFIAVREDERVKVNVPLALTGKAEGVAAGGVLSQSRREVEVWALPKAIPERIEVDVTSLKIAQALHIKDVKLPEGVAVKTTVNFTIAVISAPEAEVAGPAAAATPAAGATAAGPAAAAAPAAAPAKGEAKKEAKK